MSEPIFMFNDDDPEMREAYDAAHASFKYFWRELSWERRRIAPGLDMSMVKLPFTDGPRTDGHSEYEQMWVGAVDFDGENLSGELLNAPNWLTSVQQGDKIRAPFAHLRDWLMTVDKRAYGGFTVNQIRAKMDRRARKKHDEAWGLDFGDPSTTLVEIEREPNEPPLLAGVYHDHPMCLNMLPMYEAQLRGDPDIMSSRDDRGWTLLHSDALAGNFALVRLLVQCGADVSALTTDGRDAAALARGIGWKEIADYLEGPAKDEQGTGASGSIR